MRRRIPFCVLLVVALSGCGNSIWDLSRWGRLDEVKAIVESDPASVHLKNKRWEKTPLFFSVTFDQPEVTKYLIEKGADVKARDVTGLEPLHAAAWMNQQAQADILLEHGADLEAKDNFGDTALHVAAHRQLPPMYVYLIKKGADVNAKNNEGLTPLALAEKKLSPENFQRFKSAVDELQKSETNPTEPK
jgi:tankyrase